MKTYSIIIPHHNDLKGLKRLLKSIYEQDFCLEYKEFVNNLTIVVVDDYSEKCNVESIKELNKAYDFIFIQNYKNKSAGACRNIALANVNTDYVLFSDSDDFFIKDYFKLLLKYDSNDSDILFFSPTSVFDDDLDRLSDRHFFYKNMINDYLKEKDKNNENRLRYMWLGPWSKRFSLKYLKENNIHFDETIASNDVMFSVQAGYKARTIFASQEVIYCLTRRFGSLIYSYSLDILKARVDVGIRYKNYCDSIGFYKYKDHCINHLMRGMVLGFKPFMKLLYFAKRKGVFKDKKYVLKFIFKAIAGNIVVFFINNTRNLLKIEKTNK